jgi:hypothetical protein
MSPLKKKSTTLTSFSYGKSKCRRKKAVDSGEDGRIIRTTNVTGLVDL